MIVGRVLYSGKRVESIADQELAVEPLYDRKNILDDDE